jgi:hypothetical protein
VEFLPSKRGFCGRQLVRIKWAQQARATAKPERHMLFNFVQGHRFLSSHPNDEDLSLGSRVGRGDLSAVASGYSISGFATG